VFVEVKERKAEVMFFVITVLAGKTNFNCYVRERAFFVRIENDLILIHNK